MQSPNTHVILRPRECRITFFNCCLGRKQTCELIFMSIELQNYLNGLLLHESDAEMFALSDGGLEKQNICFHR